MKTRLPSAPLTFEDHSIALDWGHLPGRTRVKVAISYRAADRRDADLMWAAQQFSPYSKAFNRLVPSQLNPHYEFFINVGGELPGAKDVWFRSDIIN